MCGRFSLFAGKEELVRLFGVELPADYGPRYNIAPRQEALVITNDKPAEAQQMEWGYAPSWDAKKLMINARAESAAEKPAFKESFLARRCAVLADGFYEWVQTGKTKQPWRVESTDGPFALAGLWNEHGFTILTVEPNDVVRKLHDRMPAMLPAQNVGGWLETPSHALLQPWPSEKTMTRMVSTDLNNPRNDSAAVLRVQQQTL